LALKAVTPFLGQLVLF